MHIKDNGDPRVWDKETDCVKERERLVAHFDFGIFVSVYDKLQHLIRYYK